MKRFSIKKINIFLVAITVSMLIFSSAFFLTSNSNQLEKTFAENQQETSSFIEGLANFNQSFKTNYMLSDDYYFDGENQITTDFCWLFSSLKCLETSYMVQKNEWYNFSETGMAYLNYLNSLNNGYGSYDTTGNILTFNTVANNYGLVLENDVSNDLLLDINEGNYRNYSYISNLANKNLMKNTKLVSFGVNSYFNNNLSYAQKIYVLKNFITNYGGLFLAFGEGNGVVFRTSGIPQYSADPAGHEYDGAVSMKRHSVCIVGWNEKGFIALNSWGYADEMYQYFCIPYDTNLSKLDELFSTVRGFILTNEEDVKLLSGSNNKLLNIFKFNDNVNLHYKLKSNFNLNEIKVVVYKGTEDVTYNFDIDYNNENSTVLFSSNFENKNISGGYTIRFYVLNELVDIKSFLINSGSEVVGVMLEKYIRLNQYELEDLSFNNSYLSGIQSTTYLINPYGNYRLRLRLSCFNECQFLETDPTYERFKTADGYDRLFEISTIKVQKNTSSGITYQDTGLTVSKQTIAYDLNNFVFELPAFNGKNSIYQNKLLTFDIVLNSTNVNGEKTKYTFILFVADKDGAQTSQNYKIHYELGGGKNSELNISNYPNYQTNSGFPEIVLNKPTKSGYEFLGWYKDSQFKNQILKINNSFSSDIVLYAKWDTADVSEYILTNIDILSIKDYFDTEKTLNKIEYGDTITFNYGFNPQGELIKYNYSARIVAYFMYDAQKIYIENLNNLIIDSEIDLRFDLGFPEFEIGQYKLIIETNIIINNVATIKTTSEKQFEINKKEIEIDVEQNIFAYDGQSHFPQIVAKNGDVFQEDLENFKLKFNISSQRNAGKYKINISSLNKNYKIKDGFATCEFEILPQLLTIDWSDDQLIYNAKNQYPSFKINGILNNDNVSILVKNDTFKEVGNYEVEIDIDSVSNRNYYVLENKKLFEIIPANIKITFENITEKLRIAPEYRKQISYSVSGGIFENIDNQEKEKLIESLNLKLVSDGINAKVFGKYPITCTYNNPNFSVEIIDGVYNLIAPYKVIYKLPNGLIYEEEVEENNNPKGINRQIYNYTIFQVPEYSQNLVGDGTENLYITVTIKDYTIYFIAGAIVATLIVVYLFITRKQRRNKVS